MVSSQVEPSLFSVCVYNMEITRGVSGLDFEKSPSPLHFGTSCFMQLHTYFRSSAMMQPLTLGLAVSEAAPSTPCSGLSSGASSHVASFSAPSGLAVRRPPSSTQLAGGVVYAFRCAKCNKVLPMTDMSPHRRNVCIKDTRSYKSLTERWAKNRTLKIWWDGLQPDARINWFCKNQECQPGEKRKYGEITHGDSSIQQEHMGEEELDHFIPWDLFEEKGLRRGRNST